MDLNTWLEAEDGRAAELAAHFGLTRSAVSQWKTNGVPLARMKDVRDFTQGAVSLDEMVPGTPTTSPRKPSEHASAKRGSDRPSNFRER